MTWGLFHSLEERLRAVQYNLLWPELNLCILSALSIRLNKISSMVPDEPDLLRHVTQLDVRDNKLTELDASVFPRLEVLHCERNCIGRLRAKGCLLKGIYASSNGGSAHGLREWSRQIIVTSRLSSKWKWRTWISLVKKQRSFHTETAPQSLRLSL